MPEKKRRNPKNYFKFLKQFILLNHSKEYQSSVSFKAIDELQNSASRFVIQMPTGSGKTRVAMEVISQFINDSKKNVRILWLAHQKELCAQAFQCFIEVWSHLRSKIRPYKIMG